MNKNKYTLRSLLELLNVSFESELDRVLDNSNKLYKPQECIIDILIFTL